MIELGHKSMQVRINIEHLATGSAAFSQVPNPAFERTPTCGSQRDAVR